MYIHDINPVIFSIFGLEIRYYGIIYALSFLTLYFLFEYIAKKKEIEHFRQEDVEPFLTGLIIAIVLGARLFHVFIYHPDYYIRNIFEILMIWKGGLSFHGGLTLGALWIWYFCRKRKIPFFQITDVIVLPAALFLALGRLANFINGELVGKVTNVSWAVQFPGYEDFRHPTQIYESLKNFFLFGVLLTINLAKNQLFRQYAPGLLTAIFIIGYGTLRFFIEFLKEGFVIFLGLNVGQILSIFTVFLGIYLFIVIKKTHKHVRELEKKVKHG